MEIQIPWLTAIPLIPDKDGKTVRWYALFAGLANLTLIVYGFWEDYNLNDINKR